MTVSSNKILHVYLGRFAPFHEGHRLLLRKLISRFGVDNCLVLIGSNNVLDERTPFKYISRRKMILKEFPGIKIMPFPDVMDDEKWLDKMEDLSKKLGKKLVFFGGSKKDLEILSWRFETYVLVDRFTEGKGISATEIRKTLKFTDLSKAQKKD
jgi:nicotinamide mononucleotide adenylyltransferase